MHFALTHYHTQTEYTSIESAIQAQNSGEIIHVLNLKKQKEHFVLWFDPPGENKLKYVKSWRREDQLELISEAK